jgi:sugar lactone lactonase YvrE
MLGESPFWSEKQNAFFWTDWAGTSIRKMDWDTKKVTKISLLPLPDGSAPTVKSMGEAADGSIIAAFARHGIGRIEL